MKTKILITMILSFVLCAPLSVLAQEAWEDLYGPDLANAPLSLRNEFANAKGKPWHKADYDERSEFLDAKQLLIDESKNDKVKLHETTLSQEERVKKAIKDREKAKKKAAKLKQAREKAKINEKKANDKKRNDMIKKRQAALKRLRSAQESHRD